MGNHKSGVNPKDTITNDRNTVVNTSLFMRMNLNIILITTFNCQRAFQVYLKFVRGKENLWSVLTRGVLCGGSGYVCYTTG